jgi:hypothetical protein
VTVAEYEKLERELSIEDETRPEVVRGHLNRAERNALAAHRLLVVARVEFETFERKCEAYMQPLRDQVIKNIDADQHRKKKSITEADVGAGLSELFGDQYRIEEERRAKAKQTVAHLERLADLWKKRAFTLQKLAD